MLNSYTFAHLQKSLGQRVRTESIEGKKYGILQYVGDVHFADGIWCGIELDEAVGGNDGMINDIRYFTCETYHGLFVPASEICLLDETEGLAENDSNLLDHTLKIGESVNLQLQKTNFQDLSCKNYSEHSSQSSQKKALNESYVISENYYGKNKLSIIAEEISDNFSYLYNSSSLNYGKNVLLASQNRKSFSAESIDKVGISADEFEMDKFSSSDESLGIIPDLLEDLTSWDCLIVDSEKPHNLNSTINLSNNDIQSLILGSQNIVSETNIDGILINSDSVVSNVFFMCNEEPESPLQTERSFPNFASTPKHEINFSDIEEDISTLTLNLSSEFHMDKSGSGKEKQKENQTGYVLEDKGNLIEENLNSLTSHNINFNDMSTSKNGKSNENNLLNVTLTFPTETENDASDSYLNFEKETKSPPKVCSNEENNVVEILNRTYETTDKSSSTKAYKALQDSENSNEDIKENVTPVRFNVNKNEEKNKVSSFQTTSVFKKDEHKPKLEKKIFRRSVGCFDRNTMMKNNANDKPVRRKSLSDSACILQKNRPLETKVKRSEISRTSLKYSVKQGSSKSSSSSQEKSVSVNYSNKNIPGGLSLKSEYPKHDEVKPVLKIGKSQECFLNETVNISPLALDVGKIVIKKPRNSLNLPRPKTSSQSVSVKHKVLSKLGASSSQEKSVGVNYSGENIPGGLSLKTEYPKKDEEVKPVLKIEKSQECFLNETVNISPLALDVGKTVIKKPRNSVNLPRPKASSQSVSVKHKVLSILGASSSQEKSVGVNYSGENIPGGLSLKTEYPKKDEEVKPVLKIEKSQECFLNKTVNISPLALDVRKTVIKKPRNSVNLPRPKDSSQSVSDKHKVLSKFGARRSLVSFESQNQVTQKVNVTASVSKRSLKIPSGFNSAALPEKEKKATRLPTTRAIEKNVCVGVPSSERNYVSSVRCRSTIPGSENPGANYSSVSTKYMYHEPKEEGKANLDDTVLLPKKKGTEGHTLVGSEIPETNYPTVSTKYVYHEPKEEVKANLNDTVLLPNKKETKGHALVGSENPGANYSSVSTKCMYHEPKEEGKANLDDTVLLPKKKGTEGHTLVVPRCSAAGARASSIPLSRIPSVRRSKLPQVVRSSGVNSGGTGDNRRAIDPGEFSNTESNGVPGTVGPMRRYVISHYP